MTTKTTLVLGTLMACTPHAIFSMKDLTSSSPQPSSSASASLASPKPTSVTTETLAALLIQTPPPLPSPSASSAAASSSSSSSSSSSFSAPSSSLSSSSSAACAAAAPTGTGVTSVTPTTPGFFGKIGQGLYAGGASLVNLFSRTTTNAVSSLSGAATSGVIDKGEKAAKNVVDHTGKHINNTIRTLTGAIILTTATTACSCYACNIQATCIPCIVGCSLLIAPEETAKCGKRSIKYISNALRGREKGWEVIPSAVSMSKSEEKKD
ncbi:MAG: hypothetical protein NTX86_03520 [Candidatus Dependentiae bacterium]|nr:hypothetical protein [Candidatus Dependentiae bacterium]